MVAYSKIDFGDLILSKNLDESILLNIKKSDMITHTFPKIDRCCKVNELNGRNIEYDGIDNLDRIRCDISKNEFLEKYIRKSQPVMILGCQDGWKAKNWSAEYLLDKYNNSLIWETVSQKDIETQFLKENLPSHEVKKLINSGYFFKIFHKLPKDWRVESNQILLDLIEGYALPEPMPECEYQNYNMVGRGDRYLMLSTGGSGILLKDIERTRLSSVKTLQQYDIHCDIVILTLI